MPSRRALNEFRVSLERVKRGQKAVPPELHDAVGQRTKLGGKPDWIQGDDTPDCPECGEPMYLVAQIDSIEADRDGNPLMDPPPKHADFVFGDAGMLYLFYCFDCLEVHAIQQYY